MRSSRSYTAVEVHAEGEQGTCYLGSVFNVPGASMRDKLRHINEVDDSIRKFLCFEPRGRPQTSANLVFPSLDPQADVHAPAAYRLHVAKVLTRRALQQATERAQESRS